MPSSPASTSRRSPGPRSPPSTSKKSPGAGYSNTKTKRSTVSTAFNTRGPSATAPTQTSSAIVYKASGSPEERSAARSVSGKASSPESTAQRSTSVVTVGTVTDPDATASELLATRTPQIMAGGTSIVKSPSVSMTSKTPSVAGVQNTSIAGAPSVSVPAASSLTGGGAGSTRAAPASVAQASVKSPQAAAPRSTSRAAELASRVPASSMADGQASSMADVEPIGHGIVDVTVRKGAKIEMVLSTVGAILFASLWIFVYNAGCFRDQMWSWLTSVFSTLGLVACLFVLFHTCFERRFAIGRGVMGCVIFFMIAIIIFLNLLDAFMAMSCICKCSASAFKWNAKADLVIFCLSLAGSLSLIAVLLVSSVVHEDHHSHNQHTKHSQVTV